MVPNGDHSAHTRGRINKRHTLVKDVTFNLVRHVRTATGGLQYGVEKEVHMETLGFTRLNTNDGRDIADIALMPHTGATDSIVVDIAVVHPSMRDPRDWTSGAKAEREAIDKWKKYSVWNVPEADVVPLVLDTYGGINKAGLEFINRISATIASGDQDRLKELRKTFRESLAIARVRGQGALIESWNRQNRYCSVGLGGPFMSI